MTSVHIDTGRSALIEVPLPKTRKNREFFEKCIDYVKDKLIHRPEIIVFNKIDLLQKNNIDYEWIEWLGIIRNAWEINGNTSDLSNFHIS